MVGPSLMEGKEKAFNQPPVRLNVLGEIEGWTHQSPATNRIPSAPSPINRGKDALDWGGWEQDFSTDIQHLLKMSNVLALDGTTQGDP